MIVNYWKTHAQLFNIWFSEVTFTKAEHSSFTNTFCVKCKSQPSKKIHDNNKKKKEKKPELIPSRNKYAAIYVNQTYNSFVFFYIDYIKINV